MRINITGDTHGISNDKIYKSRNCEYLIILGDFGYYGNTLNKLIKGFDKIKYSDTNTDCKILVIDGNQEHFPKLETYPTCQILGGEAKQLGPNIYWLRRGEVYTLNGFKFLVFGGAFSIDRAWRVEGKSWFSEEEYNAQELKRLQENIVKHNYQFDYILTHDAPTSIVKRILYPYTPVDNRTSQLLENIYATCQFKHWYFGHHHKEWQYGPFTCLYEAVKSIEL